MEFTKMHGLGNDYLYVYTTRVPADAAGLSRKYSDRHTGVGSDGIIFILPSKRADFAMRIFNADGSEAKMCGNGIRCVGKFVYDRGLTAKTALQIDTLSGVKDLDLTLNSEGWVEQVSVAMGKAGVSDPAATVQGTVVVPVDMGNPHAVIFCENADAAPVDTLGPVLEHDGLFPDGVNVEFVSVISPTEIRMRVWERGSGITMACGTGSCASVAACVAAGKCAANTWVTVHLDGGDLHVMIDDTFHAQMQGPAAFVCDGRTID